MLQKEENLNCTLIVQLQDSIQEVSLLGTIEKITDHNDMVPQFMSQDQLGNIFFGETAEGKTKIFMLNLKTKKFFKQPANKLQTGKREIKEIDCQLLAIDCDNCLEALEQNKSRILIFGSDKKLYHLKQGGDHEDFSCL